MKLNKEYKYITDWDLEVVNCMIPQNDIWYCYEIDVLGFGRKLVRDKYEDIGIFGTVPLANYPTIDKQYRHSHIGVLISIVENDQPEVEQYGLKSTNSLFKKLKSSLPKDDFGSRNIIGHMSFSDYKSNSYYSLSYVPVLDFVIFMSSSESNDFKDMIKSSLQCRNKLNKVNIEVAFTEQPEPESIVKKSVEDWKIVITGIWYKSYYCFDQSKLSLHPAYER